MGLFLTLIHIADFFNFELSDSILLEYSFSGFSIFINKNSKAIFLILLPIA